MIHFLQYNDIVLDSILPLPFYSDIIRGIKELHGCIPELALHPLGIRLDIQ